LLVRQTSAAVSDVHDGGTVEQFWGNQFSSSNSTNTKVMIGTGSNEGYVGSSRLSSSGKYVVNSYLRFDNTNATAGSDAGQIMFFTQSGGTNAAERMRIDEFGGLAIKSVGGATTAGFYGGNLVNGITAVPSGVGTPFVLGRDTGTLRSAHFGGNLKFDSGYGVLFGDAGGTGTSTSNTLDSYEEGSFTPLFTSENGTITTGTNVGRYVKVGNLVHCNFNIRSTGVSGISGAIGISGMPFTAHSPSRAGGSIWYMRSWGAALDNLRFGIVGNGSTLTFYTNSANATVASLDNNDFGTGSDDNVLECSIVYRTT